MNSFPYFATSLFSKVFDCLFILLGIQTRALNMHTPISSLKKKSLAEENMVH